MTNEDAIKKIEYRIATASKIAGTGVDGKAFEDLEMAIQALKESKVIRNKTIDEFVDKSWEVLGADDRDIWAKESIKEIAEIMKG